MEKIVMDNALDKAAKYEELLPQIAAVIADETDLIANLANITAMLKEVFDFFWVGFYRVVGEELVLGPFQGPLACTRIAFGKGVCGASAIQQQTIIVPNVHEFPGHIACSSLSNSEIVVPLIVSGKTSLVLDVDSTAFNDFDEVDKYGLEKIVGLLTVCS